MRELFNRYFCPLGWKDLIDEFEDEFEAAVANGEMLEGCEVLDMKEKYGELKITVSEINEQLAAMIKRYKKRSRTICARCGEAAEKRLFGVAYCCNCVELFGRRYKEYMENHCD